MRFEHVLTRASRWLAEVERASVVAASVIIFALMCLVFADIIGRKLFNSPVQGSTEIAELALPAIVYLGVAYVQAHREHIKLELFSLRNSPFGRWEGLTNTTLMLVMCTIITIKIGQYAWESWSISDHTMGIVHIPIWPAKAAVFFGFLLLTLRLAVQFLEAITNKNGRAVDKVSAE